LRLQSETAWIETSLRLLSRKLWMTCPNPFANVAIIVEDLPPAGISNQGLLLGLFHGIPRTEKSVFYATPPDHIFLYQRNIEAISRTEADVRHQIRATLLHEVGHYFGLSEEELRGY